jgi:hypothetical protein
MQGDVLGRERRRRWRDEEKLAIVLARIIRLGDDLGLADVA